MVAVAPTAADARVVATGRFVAVTSPPWHRKLIDFSKPIVRSFVRGWQHLQVSRSGQYSLERLHQFHDYPNHTTPLRCLMICLLTPIPSMVFVVLLDSIPLAAPHLWKSDAKIWLRMACTTSIMGTSYILQFKQVIPELPISRRQAAMVGVMASMLYLLFLVSLSWLWTFPIPFGFVVTATPFACFLFFSTVVVTGLAPILAIPQLKTKAIQLAKVMMVQSMLVYVYPLYTALFVWIDNANQPIFLVTLPLIKFVAKNLMARACAGTALEDQLPEITIFSVELFNALYISASISIASSAKLAMAVVMAFDFMQSLVNFNSILSRAKRMRIRATEEQHNLSIDKDNTSGQLDTVETRAQRKKIAVASMDAKASADALLITRKLHFSCEYLVLVEYIECFIPAICVIYTAILSQLPNAQFYPQMKDMQGDRLRHTVTSIALYVALEVTSLLVLSWFLWKQLRIRTLYQLAFVLENQMLVIQAKLFVWVTYSLTFRLEHSGMDFAKISAFLGG